jgi:PIN domain nuclease of toxin-antitoxin system
VILLDTNAIIWWITNSKQLGVQARALISSEQLVHYSAASVFEIEIKKQRLFDMPDDIPGEFSRRGFIEAPITAGDAAAIHRADFFGHDPFDQLLLAQALNRGMKFLTSDRKIIERGFDFVVDARA